jgi:hypothetical protein
MKKLEPKEHRVAYDKREMFHNSFYNPTLSIGMVQQLNAAVNMPAQGVKDNERVGDQINVSRWTLKLLIGQKSDRPNVTFRYLVVSVPKGSPITYGNWFIATTSNVLLDDPNRDFVKVIKSGIWRPNEAGLSGSGGDEYTFTKQLYVPYKKTVKFGPDDAARTHNDNDVYFILMAYDAFGSIQSDNIAYAQMASCLHYKDP